MKICSSKHLCVNPNQGNLNENDFIPHKHQCNMCRNKQIRIPPFDYKECSNNFPCINPNQHNLTRIDFGKNGRVCTLCKNKKALEIRMTHPEYQIQYKESGRKFGNHIKNKYGITLDQYDQMIKDQNNICPICEKELKDPHVDHDHQTGKVRQILCGKCNQGLGFFNDNIQIMQRAINYLM